MWIKCYTVIIWNQIKHNPYAAKIFLQYAPTQMISSNFKGFSSTNSEWISKFRFLDKRAMSLIYWTNLEISSLNNSRL